MSIAQMSITRTAVKGCYPQAQRQQLLIYEAAIGRAERERQGLFSYKVGFKVMLRSAAR